MIETNKVIHNCLGRKIMKYCSRYYESKHLVNERINNKHLKVCLNVFVSS